MSGSPVYVTGADGVARVIGAVAFGTGDQANVDRGRDAHRADDRLVVGPAGERPRRRAGRAGARACACVRDRAAARASGAPPTPAASRLYPLDALDRRGRLARRWSAPLSAELARSGIQLTSIGPRTPRPAVPLVPGASMTALLVGRRHGARGHRHRHLRQRRDGARLRPPLPRRRPGAFLLGDGYVYQTIAAPITGASYKLAEPGTLQGMIVGDRADGVTGRLGPVEGIQGDGHRDRHRPRHDEHRPRTIAPDDRTAPIVAALLQDEPAMRVTDGLAARHPHAAGRDREPRAEAADRLPQRLRRRGRRGDAGERPGRRGSRRSCCRTASGGCPISSVDGDRAHPDAGARRAHHRRAHRAAPGDGRRPRDPAAARCSRGGRAAAHGPGARPHPRATSGRAAAHPRRAQVGAAASTRSPPTSPSSSAWAAAWPRARPPCGRAEVLAHARHRHPARSASCAGLERATDDRNDAIRSGRRGRRRHRPARRHHRARAVRDLRGPRRGPGERPLGRWRIWTSSTRFPTGSRTNARSRPWMRAAGVAHLGAGVAQVRGHGREVVHLEAEVVRPRRVGGDRVRDEVQLDALVGRGEPDPAQVRDLGRHRHLGDAEHAGVEGADRAGLALGEGRGDMLEAEHVLRLAARRAGQPRSRVSARPRAARAAAPGVSP